MFLIADNLPAGAVSPGVPVFERTWARTDLPVASQSATRTWMWGPSAFTSLMNEPYREAPNEARTVQYFDKTRMEITSDPAVDPNSVWFVTNGLLAKELVTGQLQVGNDAFEATEPSVSAVAGDVDDLNGPTYATFQGVLNNAPLAVGTTITQQIHRDGAVIDNPAHAQYATSIAYYVPETNHSIAAPFWDFMNSTGQVYVDGSTFDDRLFENAFFATGFPITEPYWANVKLAGAQQDVLIQVFERRVLTYTPINAPEWRVEAGNVGQHYYRWRYSTDTPAEPPAVEMADYQKIGAPPLPQYIEDQGGNVTLTIGNQAPFEMVVSIDGAVSSSYTLPACDDCEIYTSADQIEACRNDIAYEDLVLPAGNYRLQISWPDSDARNLAGPQTYVPNAIYASCYAVVENL